MELEPQDIVVDQSVPAEPADRHLVFGVPRTVLVLSGTHGVNDVFMNIYAPLLPSFIPRLGLSLTAAGTIAAAMVNRIGGARRGTAMSVHVTGGAMGNAIAPMLFAPYVQAFGLTRTPWLALPALALLYGIMRGVPDVRLSHAHAPTGFGALKPYAGPLVLLWSAVVVRTVVSIGYSTFLPVLMTRRGMSMSEAGFVVGAYLVSGSVGGLAGGPLADRSGPRRVIAWSLALSVPLLLAALVVPGVPGLLLLTAGGFFLGSTLPVNIAYAHAIAPVATGTVSSLMLGVAWGVGGLAVPLVGMVGDAVGLQTALLMLGVLPAFAALLTLRLPERASHTVRQP